MIRLFKLVLLLVCFESTSAQCDSATFAKSPYMKRITECVQDKVRSQPYFTIGDMILLKDLSKVIDSCGNLSRPYVYRGFLYLYADSLNRAITDFDKAGKFYPSGNMNTLLEIGYLCDRANNFGIAEKYLETAITLRDADSANLAEANYMLANAKLWNQVKIIQNSYHGNAATYTTFHNSIKDSILLCYTNTINLGGLKDRETKVFLHRGDLYFRLGEYDKALADFEKQLVSHPYDYVTVKYAALANKAVGNDKKSKEFIEQWLLFFKPSAVSLKTESKRKWNTLVDQYFEDLKEVPETELNSHVQIQPVQIFKN